MYQKDDVIVYGSSGVCRVQDVTTKSFPGAAPRLYYVLVPLYGTGTVYAPAEGGKVFLRPVINAEEANALIDAIPGAKGQAEAFHSRSTQELEQHYDAAFRSHNCDDLVELIVSVYEKKQQAQEKGRKVGMVDERYMKRAETLLHEELGTALGIEPEQVPEYIAARLAQNEA